jgi:hypothetical protein
MALSDRRRPLHGAPPAPAPAGAGVEAQDIEMLRRRYDGLNREKTVAETKLEHARALLAGLKAKALEEYGTDDVDALRAKLEAMRRENLDRRTRYQEDLDRIEKDLREIDRKYAEAQDGAEVR